MIIPVNRRGLLSGSDDILKGSCLCGSVKYEADCDAGSIIHCHCETCRKSHSAAFSSVMPISQKSFKWTGGSELLNHFESSPGKNRYFCSCCGSQLIAERSDAGLVLLRVGCLDTKITDRPDAHIWRSDSASWYNPDDEIRQLSEGYSKP